MHEYPGFGLPLRYNGGDYPIGAHGSCTGSQSDLIPVRELAMMDIMEKLTEKEDWNKKVFDEEIVAKWRKEALAIPNEDLWHLAIAGKVQFWRNAENGRRLEISDDDHDWISMPEGIMSEGAFDCVRCL